VDVGKQPTLITIGFPGSHDIEFSKTVSSIMALPQETCEIDASDFHDKVQYVKQKVSCDNTSHIENCVAYLYVAMVAKQLNLQVVLSANGCDELFCGYNGYRLAFDSGPAGLAALMEEKIANELLLVDEISAVAKESGVAIRQPFLGHAFVAFAKSIPWSLKITGSNDMLRKHILRQVALEIGVPKESAMKPKKALQYGSQIHKHFLKSRAALGRDSN
jgi:asparagine synthase (glutamine-hydrolysing)